MADPPPTHASERDVGASAANGGGAPRYVAESALAYARSRWRHEPGAPFVFDEADRLAQLPLVAPDHPRVLVALPGQSYRRGRSEASRHSLVLPVASEALTGSSTFQALEPDLRARSFAAKIAWEMLPRRADKLHVTLAGGLALDEIHASAERWERARSGARPRPLRDLLAAALAAAQALRAAK